MAITSILRDWGVGPAIVRITSTDDYAAIAAPGYIAAQQANIDAINFGSFEWTLSDTVLVWYVNDLGVEAWGFFTISPDFTSLNPLSLTGNRAVTLSAAQVLAAYATPQLLIGAPGAGKVIVILDSLLYTNVGTVFAGGGVGVVQYGATVHGAGTQAIDATIPAADITAAASQVYVQYGPVTTTVLTAVSNAGIYFSNQTGAFTGGANSTLTFNLQYMIINAAV